jgi:inner membrane protein
MSLLGHIAIGAVVGRGTTGQGEPAEVLAPRILGLAALAMLPDLDLALHELIPQSTLFEHRGPSHSLAVALLVGLVVGLVVLGTGDGHPVKWAVIATVVVASHGVMDAFGQSPLGVELLWPISDVRLLAPWQVLPNPMLGRPVFANFVVPVALELVLFLPAWLYAFWPRHPRRDVAGPSSLH